MFDKADKKTGNEAEEKRRAMMACVYLHRICSESKWILSYEGRRGFMSEFVSCFVALADMLGRRKRADKVLDAVIDDNIESGLLTPVSADSPDCRNPYGYRGKLDRHFEEDEEIACESRHGNIDKLMKVRVLRAVYSGKNVSCRSRRAYARLVELVFFGDGDPVDLNAPAGIPETIEGQACDVREAGFLCDAFGLDEAEGKILQCAFNLSMLPFFMDVLKCSWQPGNEMMGSDSIKTMYSVLCGISYHDACKALGNGGKLIGYGLVSDALRISRDVTAAIASGNLDILFNDMIESESGRRTYPIGTFQISARETGLVKRLLQSDSPVNILLYGAPGTGKTEYAYAMAKECALQPLLFRNEIELYGENIKGLASRRLRALMPIRQDNSVIIVDEAENILATKSMSMFGEHASNAKKGTVNKMLDANRNKVIWILNYRSGVDPTTLRRMTYSIGFPDVSASYMRSIAKTRLDDEVRLDGALKERLVELSGQYKVSGATLDNMIKTIWAIGESKGGDDMAENDVFSDAELVFKANSELLYGKASMRRNTTKAYDVNVLNTSHSATEIVDMLKTVCDSCADERSKAARLLFYGASGTGKTEFARYISEQTNKPIVLKRCSDILGQYVGMSEMNVRDAFREAEQEDGILLFDEADSFLSDRASAHHSWERTLVNEFLTQMEEYNGILICTTNLREILDPAMARRFHFLVEFKPLRMDGIRRLLASYYPGLDFSDTQLKLLEEFDSITPGDFGQLSARSRFYSKDKLTAQRIIDELVSVQNEKRMNRGCSDRIGF